MLEIPHGKEAAVEFSVKMQPVYQPKSQNEAAEECVIHSL